MNLNLRIIEKKSAVLKAWHNATLAVPAGARADFLDKQTALIVESMGCDLEEGVGWLFDALQKGGIPDDVSRFLDGMIRVRAESDFTASQAVLFIHAIKDVVRKELGNEILADPSVGEELSAWDSIVDDLVLYAFNIYARCRENVLDAKAEEERQATIRLLKKAKLITNNE
ncbi:MAG TPA: RsbRD N-terminal domain-containing protein [Nitrospirota bacterium]|nr:RsbRD N-terminal domain-containing protein [Nitrospirota bacterium]